MSFLIELKQSVQKELDALDDAVFSRIDRKILTMADNPPGPQAVSNFMSRIGARFK